MADGTDDHHRVTPEGRLLGAFSAKWAEAGHRRLKAAGLDAVKAPALRGEMCPSCACRPGTVPNGCMQTQLDVLKCGTEGKPFLCHAPADGRLCHGWLGVRAALVVHPLPPEIATMVAEWDYSPPDPKEPEEPNA